MTTQQFSDMCARLALVADWLSVKTWGGRPEKAPIYGNDLGDRLAATVVRTYSSMSQAEVAESVASLDVVVSIDGRECVLRADAPSLRSSMSNAMAGALVRPSHADDTGRAIPAWWPAPLLVTIPGLDRSVRLRVAVAAPGETARDGRVDDDCDSGLCSWAAPVLPTERGAPPCMVGNTLDESRALFTEAGSTRGIRIDEDGLWEEDAPWPRPISGLVPWGSQGTIAWRNADTPYMMWRDRTGGDVHVEDIPFRASLAYPQQDGSVWWTAFSGGLWSWVPGEWRQLVATPPVMSLQMARDGVRLDPRGEDDSTFRERPPAPDAFFWTPATQNVTRRPLGAQGPCWSTSTAGRWTAAAYPFGDQIQLRHADGTERVLVSPAPFNVAWAGRSLVTSTREGQLLVFRDLLTQLERGRGTPAQGGSFGRLTGSDAVLAALE